MMGLHAQQAMSMVSWPCVARQAQLLRTALDGILNE